MKKKTEVQRGWVTCIRSRGWQVVKLGFENRLASHPLTNRIKVSEAPRCMELAQHSCSFSKIRWIPEFVYSQILILSLHNCFTLNYRELWILKLPNYLKNTYFMPILDSMNSHRVHTVDQSHRAAQG